MKHSQIAVGLFTCVSVLAARASGPATPRAPAPAEYRITDLGTLPGCDVTYATGVNDKGWVCGYAYTLGPGHAMLPRPFVWRSGKMMELPKLGGEYGQALAISELGDVGGNAQTKDYSGRPVIWKQANDFAVVQLTELKGYVECLLDDGYACGYIYQNKAHRAAIWQGSKMQVVGNPEDAESKCHGINSKGTAVGQYVPKDGQLGSMIPGDWRPALWKDGSQVALPHLLDMEKAGSGFRIRASVCEAINEDGIAAGWSETPNGRKACLWKDGKVMVLPAPDGLSAEARSINNHGVAVGAVVERVNKAGRKEYACVWRGGIAEDLNSLVPPGSGWKFRVASHISDSGYIVGYGDYDKYPDHRGRAFLLTPVPPARCVRAAGGRRNESQARSSTTVNPRA
jgi:uncharacterized membrane protein